MSVITRGVKNTFRNSLRTIGFSIIIAVSLGLAFSMLLANQAVRERGERLREDIGASLIVRPIGSAGAPNSATTFTDADADKLAKLDHVREVVKATAAAAQHPDEFEENKKIKKKNEENNGKDNSYMMSGGEDTNDFETSLKSAIDPEQLQKNNKTPFLMTIPPVVLEGTTSSVDSQGNKTKLVEGRLLDADDTTHALIGKALAAKNNLKLGDTFTVADKTFTIVGIFDSGTLFNDNKIIVPFQTVRDITDAKDQVLSMVILADTLENVEAVKTAALAALDDRGDIQPLQKESVQLAESLKSIETISFVTLLVALAAGALTLLLTMLLVVRERVREIGVLKALGATNTKIVGQFLVEAIALTLIGTAIGMALAAFASNAILGALISSNISAPASGTPAGGGTMSSMAQPAQSAQELASQITTLVDWQFLAYGLGIAIAIALVATAIPAFLIAKVRPAQIMRGDS